MILNLAVFVTIKLFSNQSNVMLISFSKDSRTSGKCLLVAYKMLSSAKLQAFEFLTKKIMSLMNMLNRSYPNTEPCGTPGLISSHEP